MASATILRERTPLLLRCAGTPCDVDGFDIAPGTPPQNHSDGSQSSWFPFDSQVQFEAADFLFKKVEMSHADVDTLMRLWATTSSDGHAPFSNHHDMLSTIDVIDLRDSLWQTFSAKYSGNAPPENPPDWMLKEYTVYFRDPLCIVRSMISNPDFKGQFDYAPYRAFEDGIRRWTDIMSGNWAWKQAVSVPYIPSRYLWTHLTHSPSGSYWCRS